MYDTFHVHFWNKNPEMHVCLYTILCFCYGLFLLLFTASTYTFVAAQVVKTGTYTCK